MDDNVSKMLRERKMQNTQDPIRDANKRNINFKKIIPWF